MVSGYFDWKDHNEVLAASSSFQGYQGDLVAEFQHVYGWSPAQVRAKEASSP
jgi:hypothetical protein